MISKTTNSKKSLKSSSKRTAKPFKYIASAKIQYGPFPTKSIAASVLEKVQQVPRARVSSISKSGRGYRFTATLLYGLQSLTQKSLVNATIKRHAPTATVSYRKA